jgi:hypothetical protein
VLISVEMVERDNIRTRLVRPLPEKPSRMRWATYQRLIEKANQAERERLYGRE